MQLPSLTNEVFCTPYRDNVLIGNALDAIVVFSETSFCSSDFCVDLGPILDGDHVVLQLLDEDGEKGSFFQLGDGSGSSFFPGRWVVLERFRILKNSNDNDVRHQIPVALVEHLQPGANPVRYVLMDQNECIVSEAYASIYLWSVHDQIVVCDIDGTITRSNVRGVVSTMITKQYQYCHPGVCQFFSTLRKSSGSLRFLYLTSRPIAYANPTRQFLSRLIQRDEQDNSYTLPEGPLLGHLGSLAAVLVMELVSYTVHESKASVLWNYVVEPFLAAGADVQNLFVAGFGNSYHDMQAYHMAGMDLNSIYFIDKKSQICCLDGANKEQLRRSSSSQSSSSSELLTDVGVVPCLRQAMKWRKYKERKGASFQGYLDGGLLQHVLAHSAEANVTHQVV